MLEFANAKLWPSWISLTDSLRSGEPQSRMGGEDDFFADPLPSADVLVLGHILHDWGTPDKVRLLRAAFDALPDGGALIVYDAIIDDERRKNHRNRYLSSLVSDWMRGVGLIVVSGQGVSQVTHSYRAAGVVAARDGGAVSDRGRQRLRAW